MKIGFIGLGIMGSRMVANLIKKGHSLTVHNRSQEKASHLVEKGAVWANTPGEATKDAEVLITMLADPQAVEHMAEGEDGFLNHLKKRSIWMDCSTVNPSFSHRMAKDATGKGAHFLDAPVAGTKQPAEKGELLFLVGGDKSDVEACGPLFEAMGKKVIHVGGTGMGTSLKMVVNLMLAQSMVAFSEAVGLGEALGISRDTLLNVLLGGPVTAPFLAGKREKILRGEYSADFPLQWMHKDLQLAAQSAYESGVALPTAAAAREVYALAKKSGFAEKDFSAVFGFLNPAKKQ